MRKAFVFFFGSISAAITITVIKVNPGDYIRAIPGIVVSKVASEAILYLNYKKFRCSSRS